MLSTKALQIKEKAEHDLVSFIALVAPYRVLGGVHIELCQWLTRPSGKDHQLVLLPRAHQKSAIAALYVAWRIARDPVVTILYLSANSRLAEKQLKMIKDILESDIFQMYWPDHLFPDEGKREKWTNSEIAIDHPRRKEEGIRDATVFTAGLTTGITGLHFDEVILDDVVVQENAMKEDLRNLTATQVSLIASIANPDSQTKAFGTRYHPKDLYNDLVNMVEEVYDDEGNILEKVPVYETFERVVESVGDGTGEFLWPKQRRSDGKWFGFDTRELARKRAQYLDKTQFYAQYYQNPNDPEGSGINRELFQYYDRKHITKEISGVYFKQDKLNVYAAIDFAFSTTKKADFTSICVIGIDARGNIYILDIDRFKTNKMSEYFEHIRSLHTKWGFRKLRAEVTAAQDVIVEDLKTSYFKPLGLSITIDKHRPNRHMGTKAERISATLEPRYANGALWHYVGGHCQILEEELVLENPPHDDVKDSLASACEIAIAPMLHTSRNKERNVINFNRFGGMT